MISKISLLPNNIIISIFLLLQVCFENPKIQSPKMSDNETENNSCFNGPETMLDPWNNFVQTMNISHKELFPKIFTQGNQLEWKSLKEDFPLINYPSNLLELFIKVNNWFIVNFSSLGLQENHATREEKSALDIQKMVSGFNIIINTRNRLCDNHLKLQHQLEILVKSRYTNTVNLLKVEYLTEKEDDKRDQLLQKFRNYDENLLAFNETLEEFKTDSKKLAKDEGKTFDLKFNRNEFINYHLFVKTDVCGKELKSFLSDQENHWEDLSKAIERACSNQEIRQPPRNDTNVETRMIEPNSMFRKRYDILKSTATEIEKVITSSSIEALDLGLSEVKSLRSKVQDILFSYDVTPTAEEQTFLSSTRDLISKIGKQKEKLREHREREAEERKANVNQNIRTLGSIKFESLHGFDDFLAWKKSIQVLNTHTNEYKRCSVLRSTLKNNEDIERTKNIWNYQELVGIIDAKYNHDDQLIPVLLKKLTDLPAAQNNDTMLKNIGIILNVHSQLDSLSEVAMSRFDQTIVHGLVLKLTPECQDKYEDFIFDRDQYEDTSGIRTPTPSFIDDEVFEPPANGTVRSVSGALENDVEKAAQVRGHFIDFIKRQERKLFNIRARNVNMGTKGSRCVKCKQMSKYCKCRKPPIVKQ